jgi:predicted phage terminase large subunit-like protein
VPPEVLPNLRQILTDRSAQDKLTTPQLAKLVGQLQELLGGAPVDSKEVPITPELFALRYSKGSWETAPHLRLLSEYLCDLESGKITRLAVTMPPRHGKSRLVTLWHTLWRLSRNPRLQVMIISSGKDFAQRWGQMLRDTIIRYGDEFGLAVDMENSRVDEWATTAGGRVMSVGVGGQISGKDVDLLIVDDPIKGKEQMDTLTQRDKLWDWWEMVVEQRVEPQTRVVVIHTRWHEDDLIGRMIRMSEEKSLRNPWVFLNLPAMAEEGDALGREVGAPLWEEKRSLEFLLGRQESMSPYAWSAIYQQSPSPPGGGLFNRDWWRFYKPEELPENFDQLIQCWDLSEGGSSRSDFSVGFIMGRRGSEIYILDRQKGRWTSPEILRRIKAWAGVKGHEMPGVTAWPGATAKLVEAKSAGMPVVQMLKAQGVMGAIGIPPMGSKASRADAILPVIQGGDVLFPDGPKNHWTWDCIEECSQFPNGTNDDIVDALVLGISYLTPRARNSAKQAALEAAAAAGQPKTCVDIVNAQFMKTMKKDLVSAEKRHRRARRWGASEMMW